MHSPRLRFETVAPRLIAGITREHSSNASMPQQWAEFSHWLGRVRGQIGPDAYGVLNARADGGVQYTTGVEVTSLDDLPTELDQVVIAPGRYAVFDCPHAISDIGSAWQTIWSTGLPDAQLTPRAAPSFERYTSRFNAATGLGGFEIWIPLEA
ncbi:MAG: GyrI-like domain-containing protein [Pseudomonadales bacterium]